MQRKKRTRFFAAGIMSLFMLAAAVGCKTSIRQATTRIDDYTITTEIEAKILRQRQLKGLSIDIKTSEGNVTLSGSVDNKDQKKKAEVLAKSIDGVKQVNNQLKVNQLTRIKIIETLLK